MTAAMRADERRRTGTIVDEESDSFEGNQNQWADRKKSQEQFAYVSLYDMRMLLHNDF